MMRGLSDRQWRYLWIVLAGLLFAYLAYRCWIMSAGTDFVAYYYGGARAWRRENLYEFDQTPFKYWPIVSYVFSPFMALPFAQSKFVFFLLSFALLVGIYAWARNRIGNWATLVLFCSMIRFHNNDFLNSQINTVLLGIYLLFVENRERRPWLSAFALALFASFKLTPLLLLLPLACFGRWREVGRVLLLFSVMTLIPVLSFGRGWAIYQNWFVLMRETTPYPAPPGGILQSIQGALWWFFNGILSPGGFHGLVLGVQVTLVGISAWTARRLSDPKLQAVALHAALVLAVVLSPLAWKHNYVLLWPAVLVLVQQRRWTATVAQFLLMTLIPSVLLPISKHWADRSYVTLWGALLVFFALVHLLRQHDEQRRATSLAS